MLQVIASSQWKKNDEFMAAGLPCCVVLSWSHNHDMVTAEALYTVCQKKGPTLKRYSSKLYGSILMIFGGNIQKSLE